MSAAFAPVARHGLSSFVALVDVQPDVAARDEARRHITVSQCAGCSLVDFLRGRGPATLARHPALASLVGFFDRLHLIERARATRDARALDATCAELGARRVFAVEDGTVARPIADLPRIHVVGAAPSERLAGAQWALVGPDRDGPDRVREDVARAVRAGVTKILVGYHRHTAAMDGWSDFAGAPDFDEAWPALVRSMWTLGVTELGMLMPYPACAILQWRENHPLEALRARLDLQLRRMDAESSMMCPENVSGYALYNDTRSARALGAREVFAVRFEDLVLLL